MAVFSFPFLLLQSLRDRLTKDFKTQLRTVQKRHDDAMQTAQTEWKKERQDMREQLREELQTQVLETTPHQCVYRSRATV